MRLVSGVIAVSHVYERWETLVLYDYDCKSRAPRERPVRAVGVAARTEQGSVGSQRAGQEAPKAITAGLGCGGYAMASLRVIADWHYRTDH